MAGRSIGHGFLIGNGPTCCAASGRRLPGPLRRGPPSCRPGACSASRCVQCPLCGTRDVSLPRSPIEGGPKGGIMSARHRPGRPLPTAVLFAGALAMSSWAAASPARIEFVSPAAARAQSPMPHQGVFVLDLDGLESPQAAQDLVESRCRRAPQGHVTPTCWLRGQRRDDLLVAVQLLTQGSAPACSRVLVGLR